MTVCLSRPDPSHLLHMVPCVLPREEAEHMDLGPCAEEWDQKKKIKDGSLMLLGKRTAGQGTPILG